MRLTPFSKISHFAILGVFLGLVSFAHSSIQDPVFGVQKTPSESCLSDAQAFLKSQTAKIDEIIEFIGGRKPATVLQVILDVREGVLSKFRHQENIPEEVTRPTALRILELETQFPGYNVRSFFKDFRFKANGERSRETKISEPELLAAVEKSIRQDFLRKFANRMVNLSQHFYPFTQRLLAILSLAESKEFTFHTSQVAGFKITRLVGDRFNQFGFELTVMSPPAYYSGRFSPSIVSHLGDIARDTKGDALYGVTQKPILEELFEIHRILPVKEKVPSTVGNFFKFMELIEPALNPKPRNDSNTGFDRDSMGTG